MKNKIYAFITVGIILIFSIYFSFRNSSFVKANELNARGIEKSQQNEFEGSDLDFKKSISFKFREHIPITNLGISSITKKDYSLAHEYFDKALAIEKDFLPAKYNDAIALFEWGNTEYDSEKCNINRVMIFWNQSYIRFQEIAKSGKFFEFRENPLIKKSKVNLKLVSAKIEELKNGCKPLNKSEKQENEKSSKDEENQESENSLESKNKQSKNVEDKEKSDSSDKSQENKNQNEKKQNDEDQRKDNDSVNKEESNKSKDEKQDDSHVENKNSQKSAKPDEADKSDKNQSKLQKTGDQSSQNRNESGKTGQNQKDENSGFRKFKEMISDMLSSFSNREEKKESKNSSQEGNKKEQSKNSDSKSENDSHSENKNSQKSAKPGETEKSDKNQSKSPSDSNKDNKSLKRNNGKVHDDENKPNTSNESETITEFMEREYTDKKKLSKPEEEKLKKELDRIQTTSYKQKYYRSKLDKPEKERTTEELRKLLKDALW